MPCAHLPSPKPAQKILKDEYAEAKPSGAQDGPQPCLGGQSRKISETSTKLFEPFDGPNLL